MSNVMGAIVAMLVVGSGLAVGACEECSTCDATDTLVELAMMARHCEASQWGRSLQAWAADQQEGFWRELAAGDPGQFCLELMIALKTWPELAAEITAITAPNL